MSDERHKDHLEQKLAPNKQTVGDERATVSVEAEAKGLGGWIKLKIDNWKPITRRTAGIAKRVKAAVAALAGKTDEHRKDRNLDRKMTKEKHDEDLKDREARRKVVQQKADDESAEARARALATIADAVAKLKEQGVDADIVLRQALPAVVAGEDEEAVR